MRRPEFCLFLMIFDEHDEICSGVALRWRDQRRLLLLKGVVRARKWPRIVNCTALDAEFRGKSPR